ncbi:MAG TPA: tetraacyldisaccharide 4'-kinase [Aquabacterium sp.]|nr:tetraacyldisaccharide 4'-kinase [Aquabacterium sp.]HEX5358217.1 tetraacyldisaccharide 4'-kinase [Aquabacterium sp.]
MSQLAAQLNQAWLKKGPVALCLLPLALLMLLLVSLRRGAYRLGWLHADKLPVPVLVVGNRVVGGAGKTPTTIALLQHLKAQGWRPGVLSRGYKAQLPESQTHVLLDASSAHKLNAAQTGDEPMLIWRRTGVPVMVGRQRAAGGRALLQSHPEINLLVCDDGLQHLQLQRDLEVIVFDARGGGNGWLLPAGPLREPIHVPTTPGLVAPPLVLYNANQASTDLPGHLASQAMAPFCELADWWQGRAPSSTLKPADCKHETTWAVAGIAHPQRFFDALRQQGFACETIALDDHADLSHIPWPEQARDVILTEKDAVKLDPDRLSRERPGCRVWVAALDFRPEASFWLALDAALKKLPACHQPG